MKSDLPSWATGYVDKKPKDVTPPSPENGTGETTPAVVRPVVTMQQPVQHHVAQPQPSQRSRVGDGLVINDPNARIEGRFEVATSIEVGCDLTGEISASQVVINESGNVRAVLHTVDVIISGQFDGEIVATGSVEIAPTGRVSGDIRTNSLIIARGAIFTGDVQRLAAAAAEPVFEEPAATLQSISAAPEFAAATTAPEYAEDDAEEYGDEEYETDEVVLETMSQERRAPQGLVAIDLNSAP